MNKTKRRVYSYTYKNPKIFSQRKKSNNKKMGRGKKTLKMFLILILLFSLYYLFSCNYLKIENINFKNEERFNSQVEEITRKYLDKNFLILLKKSNYLLFDISGLEKEIKESIPEIKNIKVVKKFPNIIEIETILKQASLGWETQEKKYQLDEEGFVLKETDNLDGLIKIKDTNNLPVNTKSRIVYPNFIFFAKNIDTKLKEIPVDILGIEIKETTFMIEVITKECYRIIFETSKNVDDQINKLKETLAYLGDKKSNLEYIDLTVKNKAIYKLK